MNTLKDVIDRLKVEGMLTRNSGTHSIKSMKELLTQNIEASLEISSQLKEMGAVVPQLAQSEGDTNKGDALEAKMDDDQQNKSILSALKDIGSSLFGISDEQKKKSESGGIAGFFKDLLFGGAIVGAIQLVVENWDYITEVFQTKILPTLKELGSKVAEIAKVVIPFIIDNFDTIAKTMLAMWVFGKIFTAIKAVSAGLALLKLNLLKTGEQITEVAGGAAAAGAGDKAGKAGSLKDRAKALYTAIAGFAARIGVVAVQIGAAGAALYAGIAPLAVAAAPFVLAAAGIALVLYSLTKAIDNAKAIFADTGSIGLALTEGFSTLYATIIGFVPDLLKDVVSWIARKLGFDEAADAMDDFSFTDWLQDGIAGIFDSLRITFMKAINGVIGYVNGALDWIPGFGPETIAKPFDIESEEKLIETKNEGKLQRREEAKLQRREEEATEEEKLTVVEKPPLPAQQAEAVTTMPIERGESPNQGALVVEQQALQQQQAQAAVAQAAMASATPIINAPTSNNTNVSNVSNAIMDINISSIDFFDRTYSPI